MNGDPQQLLDEFAARLRSLAARSDTDVCAMAAIISQTAENAGKIDTLLDDRFSQTTLTELLGGLVGNYALAAGLSSAQIENLMGTALAQAAAALTGSAEAETQD